jgi:hypothetical protein
MSLKIRRGIEADRLSITPDEGEFIYCTDTKLVYIGDGTTAGGNAVGGGSGSTTATEGITAHGGGGQGSATAISSNYNIVSTVASAGDSCVLDAATVGLIREVSNFGANDMDLFPAVGEYLKNYTTAPTVNAAVSIAPGNTIKFVCYTAGTWQFT